jgi:hypothetical protein
MGVAIPKAIPGSSSRTVSRCSLAKNMYAERPRLGALGSVGGARQRAQLHPGIADYLSSSCRRRTSWIWSWSWWSSAWASWLPETGSPISARSERNGQRHRGGGAAAAALRGEGTRPGRGRATRIQGGHEASILRRRKAILRGAFLAWRVRAKLQAMGCEAYRADQLARRMWFARAEGWERGTGSAKEAAPRRRRQLAMTSGEEPGDQGNSGQTARSRRFKNWGDMMGGRRAKRGAEEVI